MGIGILLENGFGAIVVSRPGYMLTPLESGKTAAGSADLYAALLDYLKVDKVVVRGDSGGGPSVYSFAARHPNRVYAFLPGCAVNHWRFPHLDQIN